jgi:predicted acyltransferase
MADYTAAVTRSKALDVYRGVTIAGMILVNYAGPLAAAPAPLKHSPWHGFTPTDLVFPTFLFIVGVAMWHAFARFDHALSRPLAAKIGKRVAWLFAVGLVINAFPFVGVDYDKLTIMGVLQRIALCYGIGSLLCLTLRPPQLVAVCVAILAGYWALLATTGGYGIADSLPGRVDRAVFGASHLNPDYTPPFEPEGLLSTIPALVNVIAGYLAAQTRDLRKLLGAASVLVALALAWNLAFPINKPLWTSSYVLLTVGLALAMLAMAMRIDAESRWLAPFVAFGMNPLLVYFIATEVKGGLTYGTIGDRSILQWMHETAFAPLFGDSAGAVVLAVVWVAVFAGVAWLLFTRAARGSASTDGRSCCSPSTADPAAS